MKNKSFLFTALIVSFGMGLYSARISGSILTGLCSCGVILLSSLAFFNIYIFINKKKQTDQSTWKAIKLLLLNGALCILSLAFLSIFELVMVFFAEQSPFGLTPHLIVILLVAVFYAIETLVDIRKQDL